MSVVLILLSASLTVAVGFLIAFIWSVKNGQYDDDYTPSVRMLFDETVVKVTDNSPGPKDSFGGAQVKNANSKTTHTK
jgi:cbb3-type cytochrome oxidase maturation protein